MWECKECGQENDDSFPHCMSCGFERERAPAAEPGPEPAPNRPEPKSEWEITRVVARVLSFVGWALVAFGVIGLPVLLTATDSGREIRGEVLWAILRQTLELCGAGLFLVLFGHVARAVVDIRESKRA